MGWRMRGVRWVALIGALALAVSACTAEPQVSDDSGLTIAVADHATGVSPADPVTVSLAGGSLGSVSLTSSDGAVITGAFDAAQASWTNSAPLSYGKTYTLTVVGDAADGRHVSTSRTFTTVEPANYVLPYLRANVAQLLDGGTFGVGQPIVVWFDEAVKDKAAAERALSVTTDPPGIVGAWHWMDDREVHWRPQVYWPANTKVHVEADVFGRDLGGGLYGQQDRSADFTIGRSKIAVADARTKHMKIYLDGAQVKAIAGHDVTAGIPVSMGKNASTHNDAGQVVDLRTNSGPHVITVKYETYHMSSADLGINDKSSQYYYNLDVHKALRISGDGEFVHLATWNIPKQGNTNTSHGCINVGPNYIYWFYDTFGAGDVVDVVGTGRKLDVRNGLGDWVLTWSDWLAGSALH